MATYMPQAQPPANPHQDFPHSTPPEMFHENNVSHRGDFAQVLPSGIRNHNRISAEYRGNGISNGSKAVPSGPQLHGANGIPRNFGPLGGGAFDGPRSPPNTKSMLCQFFISSSNSLISFCIDTSHVPCKFFKIGQCQAGKACPFLHSTDTSKFETPCKYFAKVWPIAVSIGVPRSRAKSTLGKLQVRTKMRSPAYTSERTSRESTKSFNGQPSQSRGQSGPNGLSPSRIGPRQLTSCPAS